MNLHANARTCPNSRELLALRKIRNRSFGHLGASLGSASGAVIRNLAQWFACFPVWTNARTRGPHAGLKLIATASVVRLASREDGLPTRSRIR